MQSPTAQTEIKAEIVIAGGGIAGLWLLNRLLAEGRDALLIETQTLGSGQSVASQGMIHGGVKYALGGNLTGASEAISEMPGRWRDCIDGHGEIDLSAVRVLSDHFYLWSGAGAGSRLTSFFASRMLRGRVETVAKAARPAVFDDPGFKGKLYKLVDLVLDAPSLIQTLADNAKGRVLKVDGDKVQWPALSEGQTLKQIQLDANTSLSAQHWVLTAGEGNESILKSLGLQNPEMQRRPLHQVLVKHSYPEPLYAHCLGSNPSPRLTVSSHRCRDGQWAWYLGGDLATEGIERSEAEQIDIAKRELDACLPWIDFADAQWATLRVDRAEPKQSKLIKPDNAWAETSPDCPNVIVAWPTKLTLAPDMADRSISLLPKAAKASEQAPAERPENCPSRSWPAPLVAEPCWETLFS